MATTEANSVTLEFEDNNLLVLMCGQHNQHLARIEQVLDVSLDSFGNQLRISGETDNVSRATQAVQKLYQQLSQQTEPQEINNHLVDDVITQAEHGQIHLDQQVNKDIFATTWKKKIFARTPSQARYFEMMRDNEVVFGLGPAGTGKTYMAVAWAVDCLKKRQVERIVLSRPAVEAGERLGFLPGDMKEKVDPYLRPLYDALYDMMPVDKVDRMIGSNEIEIAPLAFMRGRTLSDAFVIIDEAQNTTPVQMKMVLTRLGQGSRMVITGDLSQIDLPSGQASGLSDAVSRLGKVKGIDIIRFSGEDVVRHPVVARILKAYEKSQT